MLFGRILQPTDNYRIQRRANGKYSLNSNEAYEGVEGWGVRDGEMDKLYWIKCGCNGFYDIKSYNVCFHSPLSHACNSVDEAKKTIICDGDEAGIQPKRKNPMKEH